jgi:YbbR domain-containing protein
MEEASGHDRRMKRALGEALRRMILANFWLKLASVGLALLLWFAVSSEHALRDATLYNVPVRVQTARSDMLVTGLAYRVADVRVRGPASQIARLKPEDLSIVVDVSHLAPGRHIVALDASEVRRPAGIEILRVDPPTLPLELHRVITRDVPIRPRLDERSLAANYVVTGYAVEPERARVMGPETLVNGLEGIPTHTIPLEGVNSTLTVTAPLDLTGLESTRVAPEKVTVSIFVEEVIERRFPRRPITLGRSLRGLEVTPRFADVIVRGPRSTVEALSEREILVTIPEDVVRDLASRRQEQDVALRVHLPSDAHLRGVRCEPERARIRVLAPGR